MNALLRNDVPIRWLHPAAWWIWALCAAAATSLVSNPIALLGIGAAALTVAINRGSDAPWAASTHTMLRFAFIVIAFRMFFQTLLAPPVGTHVLMQLPSLGLPDWFAGMRIGGTLTAENVVIGLVEGLRFAVILLCIATATTLAAPSRLMRSLPPQLTTVATVLTIAITFAPHLVQDFARISAARRLRGRKQRGIRAAAAALPPVVDGALERSMQLAASMQGRGFGSSQHPTRHRPDPWQRVETAVVLSAVLALSLIVFTRLSSNALGFEPTSLIWPSLPTAAALAIAMTAAPAWFTPITPLDASRQT